MSVETAPVTRWPRLVTFVVPVTLVAIGFQTIVWEGFGAVMGGDSGSYISMAAHEWLLMPTGVPWSIHIVPSPFRYRVLVPWVASWLPFGPIPSFLLITWISLGAAYWMLLLICRQLGLRPAAAICGLVAAYTCIPSLGLYQNPYLVDAFGLAIVCGMTYALLADRWWAFAVCGLLGILAREATIVVLLLWCLRDVRRGLTLFAIAAATLACERMILTGDGQTFVEAWNTMGSIRLQDPVRFGMQIVGTWGWAFTFMPIGLLLLPREARMAVCGAAVVLLTVAMGTSFIASDVSRMFEVLMPIVVVAGAELADALLTRKRVAWLALFLALAAVQFLISSPSVFVSPHVREVLSFRVPMMKAGALWTLGAAVLARREIAARLWSELRGGAAASW